MKTPNVVLAANAALKKGDRAAFLLALRRAVEENGGMSSLARAARLSRESLYRMLSERGNPEIKSLSAVLDAFGLRLGVYSLKKPKVDKKFKKTLTGAPSGLN